MTQLEVSPNSPQERGDGRQARRIARTNKKRIAEGSSSSSSQSFFIRECRIVAASHATAANSCVVCIALVSRRGRVVEEEPVYDEAGRDQCSKLPTERTTIHSSCHQSGINEWHPVQREKRKCPHWRTGTVRDKKGNSKTATML